MVARFLLGLTAFLLAACAPSADLRIPNADGTIQSGRLVIVPLQEEPGSVSVSDDIYAKAAFEGAADHDDAFWAALRAELEAELNWEDVRLGATVPDTGFVEARALVQGTKGGYSRERWSVRTVSVPRSVDYDAYGADHVLFVRRPSVETSGSSGTAVLAQTAMATALYGPAGVLFGVVGAPRGVIAQAELIWMDSRRDAPVLLKAIGGLGGGGGIAGRRFDRETWNEAVQGFASGIAAEATGRE